MSKWLLCDFHVHTKFSDGSMELKEIIDFYGKMNFDVIAITDHILDRYSTKFPRFLLPFPVNWIKNSEDFKTYYDAVHDESIRAMKEYGMLVITGTEFTNYITNCHIVGLGIKEFIKPRVKMEEMLIDAKKQEMLIIGVHPFTSLKKMGGGLWWQKKLHKYIDVWEVGNGTDFFPHIMDEGHRLIANTDFHGTVKKNGIEGWKTLVFSEKNERAVTDAILTQRVAFHYFKP